MHSFGRRTVVLSKVSKTIFHQIVLHCTVSLLRRFQDCLEIMHKQAIFFTRAAISVVKVTNTGEIMILPRPKSSLVPGTSSLDVTRRFNAAYLLTGLFQVDGTEETSDKDISISNCDILSAAVLESNGSHMSTSDKSLSSGMTYF